MDEAEYVAQQFNGTVSDASQAEKLLVLLSDGNWHDTPSIQREVYGADHLGVARIGARVHELKKRGHMIRSRKKSDTIWEYQLCGQFPQSSESESTLIHSSSNASDGKRADAKDESPSNTPISTPDDKSTNTGILSPSAGSTTLAEDTRGTTDAVLPSNALLTPNLLNTPEPTGKTNVGDYMSDTVFQVPATVSKVSSLSNRSLRVQVDTQENLTDESMARVMALLEKYGHFCFLTGDKEITDAHLLEIPPLPKLDEEEKSPSTRYRGILWAYWNEKKPTDTFEQFYRQHYEKLISSVKEKLN